MFHFYASTGVRAQTHLSDSYMDYFSIQIDETVDDPFDPGFIPSLTNKQIDQIHRELRGEGGLPREMKRKKAQEAVHV